MNSADISRAKGGDVFVFDYDHADVAQTLVHANGDWGLSTGNNVDVSDAVRPTLDADGISLPGTWLASVTLFHLNAFSSAHVTYEGSGFSVEYALDNGGTWVALPDHGVVPLAGDADFDIRVTFDGGVLNDTAALTNLTVYVLRADSLFSDKGRTGTFTADAMTDDGLVLTLGRLEIPPTAESADNVGTVEFWARMDAPRPDWGSIFGWAPNNANSPWIGIDSGYNVSGGEPPTLIYIDGVALGTGQRNLPVGTWHHFVVIRATLVNEEIVLGTWLDDQYDMNMTVSHVALYPQVMTDAEAVALYAAQGGSQSWVVDDPEGFTIAEGWVKDSVEQPVTDIYAYSWSIVSARG